MTSRLRIPFLALAAALFALASPAHAADFHGYFRVNQGTTSNGGDQVYVGNTGQDYKDRLGNESNWAEFELSQLIAKDKNGAEWRGAVMLGYGSNSNGVDESFTAPGDDKTVRAIVPAIKQQYISVTFPQYSGMTVWGGTKYHSRLQNDLFDYFYYDTSGAGVGVDNVDLGFARLSAALMSVSPAARQRDFRPDLVLSGIKVNPNGELLIAANVLYATRNKKTDAEVKSPNTAVGPWFMVQHTQNNLFGEAGSGSNTLAVSFASGPSANMAHGEGDLGKDNQQFAVDDQLLVTLAQRWAVLVTGKVQLKQFADKSKNTAWAVAARPVVALNDYAKAYVDVSYLYNKDNKVTAAHNKSDKAMSLFKLTPCLAIAPAMADDGKVWGLRPEIRLYASYLSWNKEQDPASGAFGTEHSGVTLGAQVESWF